MIRLVAALVLWCGFAQAATLAGITLPDRYPVDGQTLSLNGMGLRTLTILNVRVYVAGLYLAAPNHDAGRIMSSTTPKVLLLQFLHSGSKEQIQRQFHTGEVVNCGSGGCDAADQADFDQMVAKAPAVAVGDTFTFVINAHGVRFYANNQLISQSDKPDLGRLILLGFIGEHPPSPELRQSLLGG